MAPVRVAVQFGTATVRVAVAGHGGPPRLVAALPAAGVRDLGQVLAEYVGPRPAELVLVDADAAELAQARGLATVVMAVTAAEAAAEGTDAVAVLDVGHSGAEATVLGSVREAVPAGGAALDAAVAPHTGGDPAAARAVREALSLQPKIGEVTAEAADAVLEPVLRQAVSALQAALARSGRTGRVLLIGGVARTPLLAELVDAAGIEGAVVADRPESAAVVGALRADLGLVARPAAAASQRARLPEQPGTGVRPLRRAGVAVAAVLAAAALLGLGQVVVPASAAAPTPVAGELVQYDYRMALPSGWAHTGGLPERRRVLLTPAAAPQGSDLIAVESSPLGYDAGAEPERAAAELRAVYDGGLAEGMHLADYDPAATYAGRRVTAYREASAGGVVVDWYIVFDGDAQLSVGCRHTPSGAATVAAACATVVAAVHRT